MDNFKFNFLDKFPLLLFKTLPCCEGFFGNLTFVTLAGMFCRNHLNMIFDENFSQIITSENNLMMNNSPTEYFAVLIKTRTFFQLYQMME